MNTKVIMTASAVTLAVAGILLIFMPVEIANYLDLGNAKTFQLILQIAGAVLFAFAMLNWMARSSIIGGIYNKPIAIANFTHFAIGSLSLIKALMLYDGFNNTIVGIAFIYTFFAMAFAGISFKNPRVSKKE